MLNPEYKIRVATVLDIADVGLLFRKFQEELGNKVDDQKATYMLQYIFNAVHTNEPIILVAAGEKKHKTILYGCIVFNINRHPYGDIIAWGEHLYVLPEYRNGKISQSLIETGEQLAKELGAKVAYFDTKIPEYFEKFGYERNEFRMKKEIK